MNNYLMYMHAGSANHGCEAIVRSLSAILGGKSALLSNNPAEDKAVGLGKICDIIPAKHYEDNFVRKAYYYACRKFLDRPDMQMDYAYRGAAPYSKYKMALSIGGDNYCYDDALVNLRGANILFAKNNIPTALVGCSVEPEILKRPGVAHDLSMYKCIIARESISYKALCEALPEKMSDRIHLLPDPAFALKCKECPEPEGFVKRHTIGINISPMILNYESADRPGIIIANYRHMIETILSETTDMIMLIPHVVTPLSDDRKAIQTLYDLFSDTGRVIVMPDAPAEQLKYMISRCRLLIAARTHASIAGYSTCVPTLVVGYSVKAAGIALDLFGQSEGYVCPVQELKKETDLTDGYRWLEDHAFEQKGILKERIRPWIVDTELIADVLKSAAREDEI
ncbi:MAG: polysaccharide pyruvyl transferase family protein [Lachnospiraceae bacterium]|nr:polysaccharide pyruvyl transferase family protein [Lachnospiraceae bacterium]